MDDSEPDATLHKFFTNPKHERTYEEKVARFNELAAILKGAVVFGDLSDALACYSDFNASDRVRYPYSGGRLEQPEWVLHNLSVIAAKREFIELGRELNRKTPDGLSDWDEWDLSGVEATTDDTIQQDDTPASI